MHQRRLFFNKRNLTGYVFVLPTLLAIVIFTAYPVLESFRISFFKHNGVSGTWVGLYNFNYVLTDKIFWKAFLNTLYMGGLYLLAGIPLPFVVASLINVCPIGKNLYKSIFFVPNVTSIVAASLIFMFIFYPASGGPANYILSIFGIQPLNWFASSSIAPVIIVVINIWHGIGYNAIIWLAGLQSISPELYKAAEVDGATKIKQWIYITIPGVKPIFVFMIIMSTIGAMKRFTDVLVIGGEDGNPAGALNTLMLYVYKYGFSTFDFGKASAASYITFVLILLITLLNFKLTSQKD